MKKSKLVALICCFVLIAVLSISATVAYLTAEGTVTNTFTAGKINPPPEDDPVLAGFLDEAKVGANGKIDPEVKKRVTENTYKLVPGNTYDKDPTVHIGGESEACYVFVKITNEISSVITDEFSVETDWKELTGYENVYYQTCPATAKDEIKSFVVFENFTVKSEMSESDLKAVEGKTIVVNAYIIQQDGFTGEDAAVKAYEAVTKVDD